MWPLTYPWDWNVKNSLPISSSDCILNCVIVSVSSTYCDDVGGIIGAKNVIVFDNGCLVVVCIEDWSMLIGAHNCDSNCDLCACECDVVKMQKVTK